MWLTWEKYSQLVYVFVGMHEVSGIVIQRCIVFHSSDRRMTSEQRASKLASRWI